MVDLLTAEDSSKKHPFPCPCTYRRALSHYLDVTSNPRTHVLKELAEYTSDSEVSTINQSISTVELTVHLDFKSSKDFLGLTKMHKLKCEIGLDFDDNHLNLLNWWIMFLIHSI